MKKRILFLMSDTGGGHRAAAHAIEEAIQYLYPNMFDILIEDIWRGHTPWPISKIPNSYAWLTGPGLLVWKFMWSSSALLKAHKLILPSISPVLERKAVRYLKLVRPDIVVSVHPFMNHLGLKWLKGAELDIPFVTVVTDMVTIHPLWICPKVTRCLVSTEAARDYAIKGGMAPGQVEICGQPIGLQFTKIIKDKKSVRQKLGLDLNRPAVMIMGGGEGFGRVYDIARAVAGSVPQAQLLIISGRNKPLKAQLEAANWEIPTRIYGFVDNVPELMGAADVLITKAGPGTISEAFVAGLPIIVFGYIPWQEWGNVTYVQEHRAGAYSQTPQEIAELVVRWLDPENDLLQKMVVNANKLGRPNASLLIAEKICSLARDKYPVQQRAVQTKVLTLF